MNALYQAVNQNLAQMKADGQALPNYAHVGAVLEKPGTGAILAMYGGPSYSARHCAKVNCQLNMALQSRNQVGSSFKPYVLATAVKQGMDVQDSILNGDRADVRAPRLDPARRRSRRQPPTARRPGSAVNIPGENSGPLSVAKAAAHRPTRPSRISSTGSGTQATINMAKAFGVNTPTTRRGPACRPRSARSAWRWASPRSPWRSRRPPSPRWPTAAVYVTPHVIKQITQNGNSDPAEDHPPPGAHRGAGRRRGLRAVVRHLPGTARPSPTR